MGRASVPFLLNLMEEIQQPKQGRIVPFNEDQKRVATEAQSVFNITMRAVAGTMGLHAGKFYLSPDLSGMIVEE